MSIHEDIVTALASVAGGKVYPQAAPEGESMPFVVFRRIARDPQLTIHSKAPDVERSEFIFECWASDLVDAIELADDVIDALEASSLDATMSPIGSEEYEPFIDCHMEPVQFSFWH
jgi:hypothetical protein